ncbi:MAG: phosphoglycerate kinase [Candidatus Bathyarchaeota archaeon]|nr:phosphoglycerate kinase [Candidatus Bathyarchaeota archaeon]
MVFNFLTLDDVEVKGKTVFLRVDINSPLDPKTKRILDDSRIKAVEATLRGLKEAKVVLGAHQSRPGKYDFTNLEAHARVLQMYTTSKVSFVEDIDGIKAQDAIKTLQLGEILVLNNLRMHKDENLDAPPAELAKTEMVKNLAPYFDLTVNDAFAAAHRGSASLTANDAFAAAHRGSASLTAFGEVMPLIAGRLMEKELNALNKVLYEPVRPCVYLLGGAKVDDRIPVIKRVLRDGIADHILIGGLIRENFHMAQGLAVERYEKLKPEEKKLVDEAGEILRKYEGAIELPNDVALDINNERVEIMMEQITDETNIYDIGLNTIAHFSKRIQNAGTVVAEGPLGMFERRGFDVGTKELLRAMADSNAYTVVGGGHMGGLASMMGIDDRMKHVSTGGGAMLSLLSGEDLPVIDAIVRAKTKRI